MTEESQLEETEVGVVPASQGWFVLNARDAPWFVRNGRGYLCEFESFDDRCNFDQLGINITVLRDGEPMSMYHWEADQEDFLVVAGEAVAIVEGEERRLGPWDLLHCPAGVPHTIVAAGSTPCVIVAVGARDRSTGPEWGAYTVDEAAVRHGAGVEEETTEPSVAYARFGPSLGRSRYPEGLLPDEL
jgi:uncharacterized cupin superfamily protein